MGAPPISFFAPSRVPCTLRLPFPSNRHRFRKRQARRFFLLVAIRCGAQRDSSALLHSSDDAKVRLSPPEVRTLHGQPGTPRNSVPAVAIVIRATLVLRNLDLAFGHRHVQVPARAWSFGAELKARRGRWSLIRALGVRAAAGGLGSKAPPSPPRPRQCHRLPQFRRSLRSHHNPIQVTDSWRESHSQDPHDFPVS